MATSSIPNNQKQPGDDERLTAALAHASIIANVTGLLGLVLLVVLWATQRERSRFVRAHIVQSLIFQGATLLALFILMLGWSLCLLLSLLPMALRPELYVDGSLPDTFWLALFGLLLPLFYGIAALVYALYGAYRVYHGRAFVYPLAGRSVRQDLLPGKSLAAAPSTAPSQPVPTVAFATASPAVLSPMPPARPQPAIEAVAPAVAPPALSPPSADATAPVADTLVPRANAEVLEPVASGSAEKAAAPAPEPTPASPEKAAAPAPEPATSSQGAPDVFPPAPASDSSSADERSTADEKQTAVDDQPSAR